MDLRLNAIKVKRKSRFEMQMHCSFQYFTCLILFSGIAFSSSYNLSESEEFCPTFCSCDYYDGLNRANCSSQRLISPNVELSSAVEILDLSHNDVTILDNNCFQRLVYLRHLNLSHNSIHTIYLDAFSSLRSVTRIDLSYNRLEYLDERIFEANLKLSSLSLAANKFMSLQNKPLLRSFSLHSLNLRRSQITYLYEELFLALPSLRELDLSQNLMITLNVAAFGALQNLEYINLNENRWHCDRGLLNPLEVLYQRGIKVESVECRGREETVVTPVMFERMKLLDPSDASEVDSPELEEPKKIRTKIANVWRRPTMVDHERDGDEAGSAGLFQNSEELKTTNLLHPSGTEQCDESWYRLCHKYRSCLHNISSSRHKEIVGSTMGFTMSDLCFVFLLGISVGVIFVVCIISCTLCIKCCCEIRRKHDYQTAENTMTTHTMMSHPMLPHQMVPQPETLLAAPQSAELQYQHRTRTSQRRAPRRPTANNRRNAIEVRRDYVTLPNRDNFLSRLFGRPARHQYYRSINHNTATLIRRLSRSNLFSNRLSQHFAEETNGRSQQQYSQQQQRTPTALSLPQTSRQDHEDFDDEISLATEAGEISSEQRVNPTNRPETPPPSYCEVVINIAK